MASENHPSIELLSNSPELTEQFAAALAGCLRGGDVIALFGELGAGKTCFVRGLARGLGLDARQVSSPTFVLVQEYHLRADCGTTSALQEEYLRLVHVDAYRLSDADELTSLGWAELLAQPDVVLAVEWPERIAKEMPAERINVVIHHAGEALREIVITVPNGECEHALRNGLMQIQPAERVPVEQRRCTQCGRVVAQQAEFPFCSERCKLADLGNWFSGRYQISREIREEDEL